MAASEGVKKCGWLEKEGHLAKNWKKRWFVLKNSGSFSYFDSPDSSRPLGTIVLKNATIQEPKSERAGRFAWRICAPNAKESKYILAAETRGLMEEWKAAILAAADTPSYVLLASGSPSSALSTSLEVSAAEEMEPTSGGGGGGGQQQSRRVTAGDEASSSGAATGKKEDDQSPKSSQNENFANSSGTTTILSKGNGSTYSMSSPKNRMSVPNSWTPQGNISANNNNNNGQTNNNSTTTTTNPNNHPAHRSQSISTVLPTTNAESSNNNNNNNNNNESSVIRLLRRVPSLSRNEKPGGSPSTSSPLAAAAEELTPSSSISSSPSNSNNNQGHSGSIGSSRENNNNNNISNNNNNILNNVAITSAAAAEAGLKAHQMRSSITDWIQRAHCGSLARMLELLDASDAEKVVPTVMSLRMTGSMENGLAFLEYVTQKEVLDTSQEGTLFRRNSVASRCVSAYCMSVGRKQLKILLERPLKFVCSLGRKIEVDPSRLAPNTAQPQLLESQRMLRVASQHVLDAIISDPLEWGVLRKVCVIAARAVSARFPSSSRRIVGGILFLRFLVPAVTAPDVFDVFSGADKQSISIESRRALVLVGKLLQNLANDVEFGAKEAYLLPLNSFVTENSDLMRSFLDYMSLEDGVSLFEEESSEADENQATPPPSSDEVDAFIRCLLRIQDKVAEETHNDNSGSISSSMMQLLGILESSASSSRGAVQIPRDRRYWAADDERDACHNCGVSFNLSLRKHHCRRCGEVFCNSCTRWQAKVPERSRHSETRVCDSCHQQPAATPQWVEARVVYAADDAVTSFLTDLTSVNWAREFSFGGDVAVYSATRADGLVCVKGEVVLNQSMQTITEAIWNVQSRREWDSMMSSQVEHLGFGGPLVRVLRCRFEPYTVCKELVVGEVLRKGSGETVLVQFTNFPGAAPRTARVALGSPSGFVVRMIQPNPIRCRVTYALTATLGAGVTMSDARQFLMEAVAKVGNVLGGDANERGGGGGKRSDSIATSATSPSGAGGGGTNNSNNNSNNASSSSSSSSAAAAPPPSPWPPLASLLQQQATLVDAVDDLGWDKGDGADAARAILAMGETVGSPQFSPVPPSSSSGAASRPMSTSSLSLLTSSASAAAADRTVIQERWLASGERVVRVTALFDVGMKTLIQKMWGLEVVSMWDSLFDSSTIEMQQPFASGTMILLYSTPLNPGARIPLFWTEQQRREKQPVVEFLSFSPVTTRVKGAIVVDRLSVSATANGGSVLVRTLCVQSDVHSAPSEHEQQQSEKDDNNNDNSDNNSSSNDKTGVTRERSRTACEREHIVWGMMLQESQMRAINKLRQLLEPFTRSRARSALPLAVAMRP